VILAIPCDAATITVDDDGPADFNNIQAAIDAAGPNDMVIVSDGTYTGLGNHDIDFNGKSIIVRSENGPENCIIDCNGDTNNYRRGFYFHSSEDANSVLEGFTITNGYQVSDGGGIFCQSSSPTITNCIITENTVTEDDGGIPHYGAGIGLKHSDPTITWCRITDNNALGDCMGGGIRCYYSDPIIKNCIITGNSGFRGGAINCRYSSPEIINCLLTGNTAEEYGGGIACKSGYHTPKITNCTISGNTADRGGAIDLITTTATITNCIFWGNSPSEIAHTATGTAIVTYSNVQDGWAGEGNINANPLFASGDNYRLVFGSPCIDTGTNSPPGGLPATDLDEIARPFDGDYDGNSVADMGAYEFHQDPNDPVLALTPASFRFTCPVDGPNPGSRTLYIWNAGGGVLQWQVAGDCNWLAVTPTSGQLSGDVDEAVISVDANGLASDKYDCVLTVSDPCDANNTRFVPVTFRVGPTLHVPADYNNIQAAIDASFDGDEVIVADGVYTGNGNRDIDFLGKAITVRSESGPNDCIVDCQGTSEDLHRGFYFHSCEDEDSILDGFTIINGYLEGGLPEGAGVFCLNACTNPTIRNCIIKQNKAYSGGGISCYGSSATIMNCTITNNEAYYDKGGGILCWDNSSAKITGCTISDNEAKYHGGGIYFYGGSPVLTDSILWGNTVGLSPQQIELGGGSSLSVRYCDVQGGWAGVGNINVNPNFVDPLGGDYHLLLNSPCIDAGDPNYKPAPEELDIDGEPRVMGNRVDIGSDEVSDMLADFDDNGIIASQDLGILSQTWISSSGEANWEEDCDLNLDNAVNFTDYAIFAKDWYKEIDTVPPTEPNNLTIIGTTYTTISLSWDESMDNISVAGYKVYRDGSYVDWAASTNFTDSELEPDTIYTYKVSAYDAAYNESGLSDPCQATTTE
jgi:parallel beta-helix repeat protein/predicted outer membrane repeat protein